MNTKPPRYEAVAEAGRIAAESEEMEIFRRALHSRVAKRRVREAEKDRFKVALEQIRDSDYANPWSKNIARDALNNG